VELITDFVEESIIHEMLEERPQDIQQLVQDVGKYADIERIWIFNLTGKITFSSDEADIGKMIPRSRLERYMGSVQQGVPMMFKQEEHGKQVHALVKPILNRPACHRCHDPSEEIRGILHIDFSLAKARNQIASIHSFVLFSAIVTIASLALGLWILLSRLVGKAEGGDLGARVRVRSQDELGRLGESFNYMVGSLREAKSELEAEHQRQLEQADKMATLGQLASAVAHEVKNPLGGVSGAMQVLAEDYSVDDPKREIIEEMLSQLRRLDNTVKDLLSFARPASPEPIPCNPNDLAERALFFIRQQARNSQVAIVTDYGANLPQVNVDCQQIQQVVLNIALNAVQAMHEEGTLTVKTSAISHQPSAVSGGSAPPAEYDCVEVAVSDTGKGIPPDDHKKIFQPFFTTKHRGTGLGLPICQRIVEQHGGFIYIESELGKGTTVTVRLPAEDSQS
jgi:signal transduction histidine kinase